MQRFASPTEAVHPSTSPRKRDPFHNSHAQHALHCVIHLICYAYLIKRSSCWLETIARHAWTRLAATESLSLHPAVLTAQVFPSRLFPAAHPSTIRCYAIEHMINQQIDCHRWTSSYRVLVVSEADSPSSTEKQSSKIHPFRSDRHTTRYHRPMMSHVPSRPPTCHLRVETRRFRSSRTSRCLL